MNVIVNYVAILIVSCVVGVLAAQAISEYEAKLFGNLNAQLEHAFHGNH